METILAKDISISKGKLKIKTKLPGMIVFAQSWCGYCQSNKPIYSEVAELMMGQKLKFYYISGDSSPENERLFKRLTKNNLLKGYPSIFFFNEKGDILSQYHDDRSVKGYLRAICAQFKCQ